MTSEFKSSSELLEAVGGEAAAVIEAMEKYCQPSSETLELGGKKVELVFVPKGMSVYSAKKYFDEYRTAPDRRTGTARLTTLQSFCDHVNRFSDEHSALFADDNSKRPKLVGVLNYHPGKTGEPRFGDHRAEYTFPIADEWTTWTSTQPMAQAAFAEFLEDHIGDVIDPSKGLGPQTTAFIEQLEIALATPSQLMTLSKGLTVYAESRVTNKQDLATGEGHLAFEVEHRDSSGAPLKVPRGFAVGIPVFTGGDRYTLPIRLRYRVSNGKVTWELKPHRVELAFRHAITEACAKAAAETKLPLFYGTPE
jgi:uncharacterized protein YfdQ (DUF2303 family)